MSTFEYEDLVNDPARIDEVTDIAVLEKYAQKLNEGSHVDFLGNSESVVLCLRSLATRRKQELVEADSRRQARWQKLLIFGLVPAALILLILGIIQSRQAYLNKTVYIGTLRCYVEVSNSSGTITNFPAIFDGVEIEVNQEETRRKRNARVDTLQTRCQNIARETGLPLELSKIHAADF